MRKKSTLWIGIAVAALLAVGGYWYWQKSTIALPAPVAAPVAIAPPVVAPTPEPAIRYPLEPGAEADRSALPPPDQVDAYVSAALIKLLGQKFVLTFLQTDAFARRVVVTVDNLAREHAAPRLWPVNPTGGRLAVSGPAGAPILDSSNDARDLPFVRLVESVNPAEAVALYTRLYPLFQRAYEELGYPGRYFNDRLVEVIDHLLTTPVVAGPVRLRFTEVKGPIKSSSPWLHYDYADASLEAASAGRKILLRVGTDNRARLKVKLVELRRLLTARGAPQK